MVLQRGVWGPPTLRHHPGKEHTLWAQARRFWHPTAEFSVVFLYFKRLHKTALLEIDIEYHPVVGADNLSLFRFLQCQTMR